MSNRSNPPSNGYNIYSTLQKTPDSQEYDAVHVSEGTDEVDVNAVANASARAFASNHTAPIITAIVATLVVLALLATAATGGAGWLGGTAFAKANLTFLHLDKLNTFLTQFNSWLPEAMAGGGIAGYLGFLAVGTLTLGIRAITRGPNTDSPKRINIPKVLAPEIQKLVKPIAQLEAMDFKASYSQDSIANVAVQVSAETAKYMHENDLIYIDNIPDGFVLFTPEKVSSDKDSPLAYHLARNEKTLTFEGAKQIISSAYHVIISWENLQALDTVVQQFPQGGEGKEK